MKRSQEKYDEPRPQVKGRVHCKHVLEFLSAMRADTFTRLEMIMASVQEVKDAQARTSVAVQALADAIAAQVPPVEVATGADLDGFVAMADAQTAAVDAIPR